MDIKHFPLLVRARFWSKGPSDKTWTSVGSAAVPGTGPDPRE